MTLIFYRNVGNFIIIASTGHEAAQKPHSSQNSASMWAKPSFMEIAAGGHTSKQLPHPVHLSLSMNGTIYITIPNRNPSWIALFNLLGFFASPMKYNSFE